MVSAISANNREAGGFRCGKGVGVLRQGGNPFREPTETYCSSFASSCSGDRMSQDT
jgi:hypothetical protein